MIYGLNLQKSLLPIWLMSMWNAILILTIVAIGGVNAMSNVVIDPELVKQLTQAKGKSVPTIIVCEDNCDSVIRAVRQKSIQITSTESSILGSIAAEINVDQLEILKGVPGISSIEFDQEVKALDNSSNEGP